MDKPRWKVSREFAAFLLVCFSLWAVVELLFPAQNLRTKAMIVKTRSDERRISVLLEEQAAKIGGLTSIHRQFIADSLFSSQENYFPFTTNNASEVVDPWRTPYQIRLAGPTNFIVRSAGKNRKFGDADDIVFNGISNNFVEP